ncbi:hypothetical protein ACOSQ3_031921 [Xanthoceras sorbifolium]
MGFCKRFKFWADYYICWCIAAAFASFNKTFNKIVSSLNFVVLVFGYKVVRYSTVTILITYFTGYPNYYNFIKAARFVNILETLTASLVIVVAYMSDALFGHFKILTYSVLSTIISNLTVDQMRSLSKT